MIGSLKRTFSRDAVEPPEPSYYDTRPDAKDRLLATLVAVLDDYGQEVHSNAQRRGPWIFRKLPKQELFELALLKVVEAAVNKALGEHSSYLYSRIGWQCVCSCKEHNVAACVLCFNTQGCPEHSSFTADEVDKATLVDAPLLSRALIEQVHAELGLERVDWPGVDQRLRGAVTEACRKVVCGAVATCIQEEMERLERIREQGREA